MQLTFRDALLSFAARATAGSGLLKDHGWVRATVLPMLAAKLPDPQRLQLSLGEELAAWAQWAAPSSLKLSWWLPAQYLHFQGVGAASWLRWLDDSEWLGSLRGIYFAPKLDRQASEVGIELAGALNRDCLVDLSDARSSAPRAESSDGSAQRDVLKEDYAAALNSWRRQLPSSQRIWFGLAYEHASPDLITPDERVLTPLHPARQAEQVLALVRERGWEPLLASASPMGPHDPMLPIRLAELIAEFG